jgi:hypothetical protein
LAEGIFFDYSFDKNINLSNGKFSVENLLVRRAARDAG